MRRGGERAGETVIICEIIIKSEPQTARGVDRGGRGRRAAHFPVHSRAERDGAAAEKQQLVRIGEALQAPTAGLQPGDGARGAAVRPAVLPGAAGAVREFIARGAGGGRGLAGAERVRVPDLRHAAGPPHAGRAVPGALAQPRRRVRRVRPRAERVRARRVQLPADRPAALLHALRRGRRARARRPRAERRHAHRRVAPRARPLPFITKNPVRAPVPGPQAVRGVAPQREAARQEPQPRRGPAAQPARERRLLRPPAQRQRAPPVRRALRARPAQGFYLRAHGRVPAAVLRPEGAPKTRITCKAAVLRKLRAAGYFGAVRSGVARRRRASKKQAARDRHRRLGAFIKAVQGHSAVDLAARAGAGRRKTLEVRGRDRGGGRQRVHVQRNKNAQPRETGGLHARREPHPAPHGRQPPALRGALRRAVRPAPAAGGRRRRGHAPARRPRLRRRAQLRGGPEVLFKITTGTATEKRRAAHGLRVVNQICRGAELRGVAVRGAPGRWRRAVRLRQEHAAARRRGARAGGRRRRRVAAEGFSGGGRRPAARGLQERAHERAAGGAERLLPARAAVFRRPEPLPARRRADAAARGLRGPLRRLSRRARRGLPQVDAAAQLPAAAVLSGRGDALEQPLRVRGHRHQGRARRHRGLSRERAADQVRAHVRVRHRRQVPGGPENHFRRDRARHARFQIQRPRRRRACAVRPRFGPNHSQNPVSAASATER